jgi:hypothetical protein
VGHSASAFFHLPRPTVARASRRRELCVALCRQPRVLSEKRVDVLGRVRDELRVAEAWASAEPLKSFATRRVTVF